MEGKIALYKRGYHIALRQLRKMNRKNETLKTANKSLKKEVKRLTNVLRLHEDFIFSME
jgi:hypothetical protein